MAWSQIYQLPFDKLPYQFNLHGFCDLQIGSPCTSINVIKRRIEEICNDPNDCGIIIPGDIEDEDRPSTRMIRKSAFAGREEVVERDAEKHMAYLDKVVIPLLLPLQKTKYGIMGILAGHHWTQLSPVINSVQYMCQELKRLSGRAVPYLGEMSSFMDMRFRRNQQSIRLVGHVAHGEGSGQSKASSINKLERMFQGFDADFYVRGHDTQLVASKSDRLYPKELKNGDSTPEMLHRTVAYLNLGSSTQGYNMSLGPASYVESKMMRPTTMGWGTISFHFRIALTSENKDRHLKCDMKVTI